MLGLCCVRFDPTPLLCRGAPTGLQGSSCGDDCAEDGKRSHIAQTGSYTSPDGQPAGEGVGALPGELVYGVPAVVARLVGRTGITFGTAPIKLRNA